MYPISVLRLLSPSIVTHHILFYLQYLGFICYRLSSPKIAERQPAQVKKW